MANSTSQDDSYLLEEQSEDTEITLGTGKMLFLFFGLVALCAVFFGMGFKVGRGSVKGDSPSLLTSVVGSSQSSTNKPSASPDMGFYKAVQQSNPDAQLPASTNTTQPAATDPNAATTSSTSSNTPAAATNTSANNPPDQLSNTNGYLVQVAAVTKEEDADALVDALKKKQYPAFATTNAADKLVHVQVGPFNDMKQAEDTRTKLMNDGYNPILKK